MNQKDPYHSPAVTWRRALASARILTSNLVFWEFLNALAAARTRALAVRFFQECESDPQINILFVDEQLNARGLELYRSRRDKDWSLTDCVSFVIMEQLQLTDALTSDHHFEQAGFRALLRQNPPS